MKRVVRFHLEIPFVGSRKLRDRYYVSLVGSQLRLPDGNPGCLVDRDWDPLIESVLLSKKMAPSLATGER